MVLHLRSYRVLSCGISDVGLVRQNNEDVWAEIADHRFFILADGMGGHQAGEVASKETVNALCRLVRKKVGPLLQRATMEEMSDLLRRAIEHVNFTIYKMSRSKPELRGMGTTLCCLLFHPLGLIFAHVGDSRIYCIRDNAITQLTKDHSLVRQLLDQGQIDDQQATDFTYKNIITKAIGTEPKVVPTLGSKDVQENDIYLMCSDGLSDLITIEQMRDIVVDSPNVQAAAEALVAAAKAKGGYDNITVVIVNIEGSNGPQDISG